MSLERLEDHEGVVVEKDVQGEMRRAPASGAGRERCERVGWGWWIRDMRARAMLPPAESPPMIIWVVTCQDCLCE